jgi:hypothetical protein
MPSLLSGGKALAGSVGTNTIFITLPTAQPSLGITPQTGTGFTLVTGPDGQLGFTSTLGSILFRDSIIKTNVTDGDLTITSNGTGTVRLTGNVRGDLLAANTGSFNYLFANTATIQDLIVDRSIAFTSATNTATFAGGVNIGGDLAVAQQLNAYGNVSLSPDGGIVDISPGAGGTVRIFPSDTGRLDNTNIGDLLPANGRFVELTATSLTVENLSLLDAQITTGTFQTIRVLSTVSDSVTVAGGAVVTGTIYGGAIYDSGTRVINQVVAGIGLSGGGNGPIVALTNTGVLSAIAGTDISVNTATGDVTISNISTLQSVTDRGMTTTNAVYAGELYDNGTRVISSVDVGPGLSVSSTTGPFVVFTNTGVVSLSAGTDTRVSSTTGNITVWNDSTLQTVTDRGNSTTNFVRITNGFSQVGTGTSLEGGTWTGAVFVVDGDGGFGGNLYIQGDFYASGKAVLTTSTLGGSLNQGDDIVITNNTNTGEITWDNVSTLQSVTRRGNTTTNHVRFLNTTNSTASTTGSIVVSGGVGVAKDVYVGGSVYSIGGGSPAYNNLLYTPQVTVSTSSPVTARIGDFWIDPSIGVEYQYVPNGTQTVWIQFIGF